MTRNLSVAHRLASPSDEEYPAAVVGEARMEQSEAGLVATSEGWFVVNVRDAAWVRTEGFGDACVIEGDAAPFAQIGYTIAVLRPGQPNGLYHREADQEDFLVLAGSCLLLVEGEERPLQAWDFVHCPAGTEHIFVGAGDGPCVIFMAGGRTASRDTMCVRSGRGAAPRSRSRDGDAVLERGVRAVRPALRARPARELGRAALGAALRGAPRPSTAARAPARPSRTRRGR
jgi:uncharacterized cupin superfamily protein